MLIGNRIAQTAQRAHAAAVLSGPLFPDLDRFPSPEWFDDESTILPFVNPPFATCSRKLRHGMIGSRGSGRFVHRF